jgi:hypothetical protein
MTTSLVAGVDAWWSAVGNSAPGARAGKLGLHDSGDAGALNAALAPEVGAT